MKSHNGEYHTCPSCGNTRVEREPTYLCDWCGAVLDMNKFTYLQSTLFKHGTDVSLDFCSWHCFISYLSTVERLSGDDADFIAMPYLHMKAQEGCSLKDFLSELRGTNGEK